jgi:sugar PTS system EIIA component
VQLDGEHFELLAAKGDSVERGKAVVRWDPAAVEQAGKSAVCPVVALEATAEALSDVADNVDIHAGDTLFSWK